MPGFYLHFHSLGVSWPPEWIQVAARRHPKKLGMEIEVESGWHVNIIKSWKFPQPSN